jgi:Dolichyl-phosphate-mannose-protein mannosyltransferase
VNRLATLFDVAITCGLALTAVLAVSSGFVLNLGLFSLRLHDWVRPLAATVVLIAARLWLTFRTRSRSDGGTADPGWRVARVALAAVALGSVGYWLVFLTTICGGSDSYGYVSASELIRSGRLIESQPIAAWLPVTNPLDVATPAGYVPAADRTGIAPSYPLGLPVLMAIAQTVFGWIGPFLVPPLCGVILLLVVWRLAAKWYGDRAGWLAAALVAWDPIVVTYAKQPMSDVSATMFALLAVWGLAASPRLPVLAGVAAGASFVTRPGGIGLIVALTAFAAWPRESRRRDTIRFVVGLAPFVLAQALLQWRLFGGPLTSGYGPVTQLFAGGSVWSNLRIYLEGMWTIHSVIWSVGLLAACFARPRTPLMLAATTLALSSVPYVLYFEFDHWETLRFLLPSIVLLTIAAAGGLSTVAARLGSAWVAAAAMIAFAMVPAVQTERFLRREGVPELMTAESRYPLVATHLKERTAPNAIVLAAQHSGSIRHYGDRLTLRWDLMRSEDLEPLMTAVADHGHPLYVVLEGTEQRRFTEGFADPLRRVHMYPFGQIRNIQIWELVR